MAEIRAGLSYSLIMGFGVCDWLYGWLVGWFRGDLIRRRFGRVEAKAGA